MMVNYEDWRSGENYYKSINRIENLKFTKHTHRSYEFVFVLEGELKVNLEEKVLTLSKNKVIIMMPYEVHSFDTEKESAVFSLIFSPNYISDFYIDTRNYEFNNPIVDFDLKDIEFLKEKCGDIYSKKSVIYKYCARAFNNGITLRSNLKNYELLSNISHYVSDNYNKHISLKEVSTALGYSYNYISDIFKKNFGVNFASYVNQYKLENAADELINTNKTATEIAADCGFSTIRNFNIAFKKYYNVSPKAYKKEKQKA